MACFDALHRRYSVKEIVKTTIISAESSFQFLFLGVFKKRSGIFDGLKRPRAGMNHDHCILKLATITSMLFHATITSMLFHA